jgi:hypothetical protein
MMTQAIPALLLLAAGTACIGCRAPNAAVAAATEAAACSVTATRALPAELFETSGLARGIRDTTLFWTHNDGSSARLHALDAAGTPVGAVEIPGLELEDWEDLASSRCGGEPCLLIADFGDNDGRREWIALHEVREPTPGGTGELLRTLRLRYPDRAQDAEALFALPDGRRFLVTKGRHGAIMLYRVPAGGGPTLTLERVRELAPRPRNERARVTAAAASPDGRLVAIRTYHTLLLFETGALLAGGAPVAEYDLRPAGELQGEAVVLDGTGSVWLTSEAEQRRRAPQWSRLACPIPTAGDAP